MTHITPPIGVKLAGGLRPRESVGVCTPLNVRAVVMHDGAIAVALVEVDLCALDRPYIDEAKALIQSRTGMPPEHVMIAASHTHAGPYAAALFCHEEDLDSDYLALLPRYIADAVTLAHARLAASEVGSISGREATVGHYRRVQLKAGHVRNTWMRLDPDDVVGPVGEIDPEVGLVLTKTEDGKLYALVFNVSVHANCHGQRDLIDGSYPVRVAERVEKAIGGMVCYTPGACGNVNPVGSVDDIADALAAEILRLVPSVETTSRVSLFAKQIEVDLPLRDFSTLRIKAIQRDWPEGEDVFTREWEHLRAVGDRAAPARLQVIAVNDTAFVANPGELFVELGREIKRQSPFKRTYVVELANEYVGYIPTRAAFDQGGYEVLDARSSKVGRGAGGIVVAESVKLLREAADAQSGGSLGV